MQVRTSVAGATLIALAMLGTSLVLAAESPTVKFGGGWIALGVGENWGDGVLIFEGYGYPERAAGAASGRGRSGGQEE